MRPLQRLKALARVLAYLPRPHALVVGWRASRLFLQPQRLPLPRTPEDDGIPYEAVTFPAADGTPLAAWWMPVEEARGTVVFLHGYGANREQCLAVAPFLHRAGYAVLAFDFRAHGESGGRYTTLGIQEVQDVSGALAWLRARGVGQVALFGWSMGGATAVRAGDLPGVTGVVADCPFATLRGVAARGMKDATGLPEHPYTDAVLAWAELRTGVAVDGADPAAAIARLHTPVLLIHGELDAVTPWTESEVLHGASEGRARFWKVTGAHHVGSRVTAWQEYEARCLEFLAAALPCPGAAPRPPVPRHTGRDT